MHVASGATAEVVAQGRGSEGLEPAKQRTGALCE